MRLGPLPRMMIFSRPLGLASQFTLPAQRLLVGRIHVGRGRWEFRGAGIDALIDRQHAEALALRPHLGFGKPREPGEPRIREAHGLQAPEGPLRIRQAVLANFVLRIDDDLQPRDEPRIDVAEGIDLLVIEAEPERLGHLQNPVGRRRAERRADHILVVALAEPLQHVVVEAGQPRLHRAQRLLQAFLEGAANRHHLADRFHGGGQRRRGAWEFLEGEARDLRHHVVDGGLEGGGRGAFGDVVVEFVERVADGELGRDLRNREAGGLRGQRRRARHARVHLDDDEPAVRRVYRELHVRAARLHADLAQDRDGGVAHHLVFAVGKRQRRGDRDAVAGMHAHRIDVLDGADDDAVVLRVADNLHLVLFPAEDGFLDQDLRRGRGFEAPLGDVHVFFAIVGDAAARAAEREGRPDDGRKLDVVERVLRLGEVMGELRARRRKPDLGHRLAEQQAILGLVDGMRLGADHLDVELFERAVAEELRARC